MPYALVYAKEPAGVGAGAYQKGDIIEVRADGIPFTEEEAKHFVKWDNVAEGSSFISKPWTLSRQLKNYDSIMDNPSGMIMAIEDINNGKGLEELIARRRYKVPDELIGSIESINQLEIKRASNT